MYPNVIFLMIDSFSSKKFHGKEKTSITPTLDKLVSEGTFFEQAISVGSTTVPSYSSVLTGLYPFQCVEKNGNLLLMNSNLKTFIQKFEENTIFLCKNHFFERMNKKMFKTCTYHFSSQFSVSTPQELSPGCIFL